jgi:hypothetical protein
MLGFKYRKNIHLNRSGSLAWARGMLYILQRYKCMSCCYTSRESNNSYKGACRLNYFEHITNRLSISLHHFSHVISKFPSQGVEVSFLGCDPLAGSSNWTRRLDAMWCSGIKQLNSTWKSWTSVLEEIFRKSSLVFEWCSRFCISKKRKAVSGLLWSSVTWSYNGASALLIFEKLWLYPISRSSTWQQMNLLVPYIQISSRTLQSHGHTQLGRKTLKDRNHIFSLVRGQVFLLPRVIEKSYKFRKSSLFLSQSWKRWIECLSTTSVWSALSAIYLCTRGTVQAAILALCAGHKPVGCCRGD